VREAAGSRGGSEAGAGLEPGEGVEVTRGHVTAAATARGRGTNPKSPPSPRFRPCVPPGRGSVQLHLGHAVEVGDHATVERRDPAAVRAGLVGGGKAEVSGRAPGVEVGRQYLALYDEDPAGRREDERAPFELRDRATVDVLRRAGRRPQIPFQTAELVPAFGDG